MVRVVLFFKIRSCYVVKLVLKLVILLPELPRARITCISYYAWIFLTTLTREGIQGLAVVAAYSTLQGALHSGWWAHHKGDQDSCWHLFHLLYIIPALPGKSFSTGMGQGCRLPLNGSGHHPSPTR